MNLFLTINIDSFENNPYSTDFNITLSNPRNMRLKYYFSIVIKQEIQNIVRKKLEISTISKFKKSLSQPS